MDQNNSKINIFDKIVALCKRRGFIYPGSEIYGGLANTYDYGPMGAELLRNIRNLWWENFVHKRGDIVGLESSLISSYKVWDASGHTTGFADALIDCKTCKHRMRADHLIDDFNKKIGKVSDAVHHVKRGSPVLTGHLEGVNTVEGLNEEELDKIINDEKIPCPSCGKFNWTKVRKFNQLFPVNLGIVVGDQSLAYLRGETAQGIFINFRNVVDSTRVRLPFGIGQMGKSFRNEITLGNSVFRTIEFEQGEIEFFFDPEKSDWKKLFDSWKDEMWNFVTEVLEVSRENLRWRVHSDQERSFYSMRTEDLEYNFPFGFKELWGIAYRSDYDLKQHIKHSGKDLSILDPETSESVVPHVIEPAVGINRLALMVLCDSYTEKEGRVYLKLNPKLAPFKAAVFPLLANKPELVEKAWQVYQDLKNDFLVAWDDRGNIGKRYASQDEIGTPYSITIDFDTLDTDTVTIRNRDDATQIRIKSNEIKKFLDEKLR